MDLVIYIGPWHVFWFGWPAHKFFPTKVNGAPSAESETSWKYLSNNSKKLPFRFTAIFIKYSYGQTESSRAREGFPVLFEICCCWILSSLRFCDYGSSKLEKKYVFEDSERIAKSVPRLFGPKFQNIWLGFWNSAIWFVFLCFVSHAILYCRWNWKNLIGSEFRFFLRSVQIYWIWKSDSLQIGSVCK